MKRWTSLLLCAWVLWAIPEGPQQGSPAGIYMLIGFDPVLMSAHQTRQDCEAAKLPSAAVGRDIGPDGKARAWKNARQVCLPDTVDPRGPKR